MKCLLEPKHLSRLILNFYHPNRTDRQCPNCARAHGVIREIRRANEALADRHDLYVTKTKFISCFPDFLLVQRSTYPQALNRFLFALTRFLNRDLPTYTPCFFRPYPHRFLGEVEEADEGFETVATMFSKGLMGMAQLDASAAAAAAGTGRA